MKDRDEVRERSKEEEGREREGDGERVGKKERQTEGKASCLYIKEIIK